MEKILSDIAVKQKQIEVEVDPEKKSKYQEQLNILNIRKQIISLQNRIDQIKGR